jgi:hypothetical protein
MRWTLWRQVISHRTKTLAADGEVVWSWRRDRGAATVVVEGKLSTIAQKNFRRSVWVPACRLR